MACINAPSFTSLMPFIRSELVHFVWREHQDEASEKLKMDMIMLFFQNSFIFKGVISKGSWSRNPYRKKAIRASSS